MPERDRVLQRECWKAAWNRNEVPLSFYKWAKRAQLDVRGAKIKAYLEKKGMQLTNLKAIEIGSGLGFFSFALAQEGAGVTLLDFSKSALEKAWRIFSKAGLNVQLLHEDAFNIDARYKGKFDVAMSFGTIEHYHYPERYELARVHKELVKAGGILIISVPNRLFLPHEVYRVLSQIRGKWGLGYEGSFTRSELKKLGRKLNLQDFCIYGSNLKVDLKRYLNLYKTTKTVGKFFPFICSPGSSFHNVSFDSHGTLFDDYLGADIFLIGCTKSEVRL